MVSINQMWEIIKFRRELKKDWDDFISEARNATFLFYRDYMDYHSKRFEDYSLMAYREGKLSAIFPANIKENTLYSHQGLTYGGWLFTKKGLDTSEIFELWKSWLEICREEDIERIVYKPVPYIYFDKPSQEDLYMLFLSGAKIDVTNISTTIDLSSLSGFNQLQKRHLKKAGEIGIVREISPSSKEEIYGFHKMLSHCLETRHNSHPVHTEEELMNLISKFPENIKIWKVCSRVDSELLGGVCLYLANGCAHCQYIATSETGREWNVLALLFHELIHYYKANGFKFFDFGTSNECKGSVLNPGLNRQKTSYGGTGVAYATYVMTVSSALDSLPTSLWPPR